MLLTMWRERNETWARQHLTIQRYRKIQRNWARASRLGLIKFSLLWGALCALWFDFVLVAIGFAFGTIPKLQSAFGSGFVAQVYVVDVLKLWLPLSIGLCAVFYLNLRESARWPAPVEPGPN